MKLLYIHFSLAVTGGIERVLVDKMNYFANRNGYEVFLVTYDQGSHVIPYNLDSRISHIDLDIRSHRIYNYKIPFRWIKRLQLGSLFKKRLRRIISDIMPDIIIGTEWAMADPILRNKGNIPYVLESHFGYLTILNYNHANIIKKIYINKIYRDYSHADTIVCLTEGDASLWKKRHSNKTVIIPNVVHLNDRGISELDKKRVIFVGRFSEEKDIPSILNIWHSVHSRYEDWELHIFGEGSLEGLIQDDIESNPSNIVLHPPTRDIFREYCRSSVLVVTSKFESFGLVILEAMSCGVPVVAFDCPFGPRDIIRDGVNGFLIPNRNIETYINKLGMLIENEDLRKEMGANALLTAKKYSLAAVMPQWERLFVDLISKKGS